MPIWHERHWGRVQTRRLTAANGWKMQKDSANILCSTLGFNRWNYQFSSPLCYLSSSEDNVIGQKLGSFTKRDSVVRQKSEWERAIYFSTVLFFWGALLFWQLGRPPALSPFWRAWDASTRTQRSTNVFAKHTGGCTKKMFPGCVNMEWKNCVLLLSVGKQTATFPPNFTQPGKVLLVQPCKAITKVSLYPITLSN